MYTLGEIRSLAERFRKAMESTDFSDRSTLRRFPIEACCTACELLGLYFYRHGIRDMVIMQGNRPHGEEGSHNWLMVGTIIVDITADQFPDHDLPPAFVAVESPWHMARNGICHVVFDEAHFDKLTHDELCQFYVESYERVVAAMNK